MLVVGLVPAGHTKRWLYRRAYIITFRIMARSLSAIITVHNKQNMAGGVCVANHTSPIDVVMLSTENCFSLVSLGHINGAVVWICWYVWCLGESSMLMYLVFEMLILPLCVCQMDSCAVVTSIWSWGLEFNMLITINKRFFVRKCGGWCHYFKFAFKLVFL